MLHKQIADQTAMEDFFRKHLNLFPDAKEIISVTIDQHDPLYVLDQNATLVEYKIVARQKDGSQSKHFLRGSSDLGQKRQKHFHVLQALRSNGFDSGINIVAKPLGYFPEFHLLLYFNVPGESLYDKIQYASAEIWQQKTRAAIDWLIDFHKKKPMQIPEAAFDPQEEQKKFTVLIEDVIKNFPDHETALHKAREKILKDEKNLLEPEKFHLIHGDFQPHNILFRDFPPQTITIDFNDAVYYEELYDIAYFITQTWVMVHGLHGMRATEFLSSLTEYYLQKRGIKHDESVERKLQLFRIKTLIHIKSVTQYQIVKDIEAYVASAQ